MAAGSVDARLDVVFHSRSTRVCADVAIAAAKSEDQERQSRRARNDGAAAAEAEKRKRIRYPHPDLQPIAVEALGRMGEGAQAFARKWATKRQDQRPAAITDFYAAVGATLQRHNADLILAAYGGTG